MGQPVQHGRRRDEAGQVLGWEAHEHRRQPGRPAGAASVEVAVAGRGGTDSGHPTILLVLHALHQAPGL